jgi:hypothetical protein
MSKKDVRSFKPPCEAIINQPREASGILSPKADEDAAHYVYILAAKEN